MAFCLYFEIEPNYNTLLGLSLGFVHEPARKSERLPFYTEHVCAITHGTLAWAGVDGIWLYEKPGRLHTGGPGLDHDRDYPLAGISAEGRGLARFAWFWRWAVKHTSQKSGGKEKEWIFFAGEVWR